MPEYFNVVMTGKVIPGWDRDEVCGNLSRLLNIPRDKTESLLSGSPVTLKRNLTRSDALRIQSTIEEAGADCSTEAIEVAGFTVPKSDEGTGTVPCPGCGTPFIAGEACTNCGIAAKERDARLILEGDLSMFVGHDGDDYTEIFPRFLNRQNGFAFSWNWAAFFFNVYWMIHRKIYWPAFICIGLTVLLPYLGLVLPVLLGVTGNYLYFRHALSRVRAYRNHPPPIPPIKTLMDAGGTAWKFPLTVLALLQIAGIAYFVGFPYYQQYQAEPPPVRYDPAALLRPTFHTTEGVFQAGMAVVVDLPELGESMLVTAHHLFGPSGGFSSSYKWDEIRRLVKKVVATSVSDPTKGEETVDTLPIRNARPFDARRADFDLAVFPLTASSRVPSLTLANRLPEMGEVVWLFARVGNRDAETLIFPATVTKVYPDVISYTFADSTIDLSAVSGAPILDSAGQVIALHVGAEKNFDTLYGFGNPSTSVIERIEDSARHGF